MLIIAMTSGKGGVGKTSVSSNLAVTLQNLGQRVVVFDADLQLANLDIALGINPEFNLQHVVAGEKTLEEIIVTCPSGVRAITGASAVPMLMSAGPKRMGTFLSQLAELEKTTDILIFDTAAGLDNRVMTFLKLSHQVIVIATPDPTSVTDAYATVKTLNRKDKDAIINVIFNMAGESESKALFESFHKITQAYVGKEVFFLGNIRQDRGAQISTRRRKLYAQELPQSEASQDIKVIANKIIELAQNSVPLAS